MNKQVTKWRVQCGFYPNEGGFGNRRRVSIQGRIEGNWITLMSFMKRDDVGGMRMYPNHVDEIALDGDNTNMLWYGQGSGNSAQRVKKDYPVPDMVFKEVFHLLYTVPHPEVEHNYTSIDYEPVEQ